MKITSILLSAAMMTGLAASAQDSDALRNAGVTSMTITRTKIDKDGKQKTYKGTTAVFDAKGNQVKETDFNADGSVKRTQEFRYDDKGNLAEEITYNAKGAVTEKVTFEYDGRGLLILEQTFDGKGKLKDKKEYTYGSGS